MIIVVHVVSGVLHVPYEKKNVETFYKVFMLKGNYFGELYFFFWIAFLGQLNS